MDLQDKTALVTGAGRGMGRAIALALAAQGANVAICDVRSADVERVVAEIEATGRRALGVETDVTNAAQVSAMVDRVAVAFGGIDVVVNNAGIVSFGKLADLTEEQWDRVMDVNAKGVFLVSKYAIPKMRGRGAGAIVNIASVVGKIAMAELAHYSASKAAVISITQALAGELAADNIRVNAVCPGIVETSMFLENKEVRGNQSAQEIQRSMGLLPDPQTPDEIAGAVVFLVEHNAITGQALNVCGGQRFY
jgi:meso-butanediol dehydrogenase / (S,S)-butanediol dehydrogenase / diacetyl reductase